MKTVTFQSQLNWTTSTSYGEIFYNSSVEKVVLYSGMETLGKNLFENAKQLKIVTYDGYVPKIRRILKRDLKTLCRPS